MKQLPIYFSDEVKSIFENAQADHDKAMKEIGGDEVKWEAFENSQIRNVYDALIAQARLDLRPDLARFTHEFFSVFFKG